VSYGSCVTGIIYVFLLTTEIPQSVICTLLVHSILYLGDMEESFDVCNLSVISCMAAACKSSRNLIHLGHTTGNPILHLRGGMSWKAMEVTRRYLYQFHIPNMARNVTPQVLIPTQDMSNIQALQRKSLPADYCNLYMHTQQCGCNSV